MKKQHGVVFEAPHCGQCGAELDLNRFAWGIGWGQTKVQYVWYCPRPDCTEERLAAPDEVPQAILDAYDDSALEYVTSADVVRRLRQLTDIDELLGY